MEELGVRKGFLRDVGCGKGVVGAGIVEKDPVDAGDGQNDGVGSGGAAVHDEAARAVPGDDALDHAAEGVVADLAQEGHVIPENLQRQAGVGHAAAGMDAGGLRAEQLARHQQVGDLVIAAAGGENRGDIQADVPGGYDFAHIHTPIVI